MYEIKLRRKISKAAVVLFGNPLIENVIKPKAYQDKMYKQMGRRLFRLMLFADTLFYECSTERTRMTGPKKEFIGLQFELFFLYLRTVYDYLAVLVNKEIGGGKFPQSFNSLCKKINCGHLDSFEKNMEKRFVKFMKFEKSFSEIKDIRDSVKMRTTTLNVSIKDKLIYIKGDYSDSSGAKGGKIDNFGRQLIFNYCWMTASWMIVINDLIIKNRNIKSK